MLPAEIDALDQVAFEQLLADELAVDRKDIYESAIAPSASFPGAMTVRPPVVLERLGVSQSTLVAILLAGALVRPGKLGHGRVAWRSDEIKR